MSTLRPFRAHVADADLADLADRLARARVAPEPAGGGADAVPMPSPGRGRS